MCIPTYKKFKAKSPQFAEVGEAMYNAWFHCVEGIKRKDFSDEDLSYLLQWMWHEMNFRNGVIYSRDNEISRLKRIIGRPIGLNEGLLL